MGVFSQSPHTNIQRQNSIVILIVNIFRKDLSYTEKEMIHSLAMISRHCMFITNEYEIILKKFDSTQE